jgi:hypothetical protein
MPPIPHGLEQFGPPDQDHQVINNPPLGISTNRLTGSLDPHFA